MITWQCPWIKVAGHVPLGHTGKRGLAAGRSHERPFSQWGLKFFAADVCTEAVKVKETAMQQTLDSQSHFRSNLVGYFYLKVPVIYVPAICVPVVYAGTPVCL